SGYSRNPAMMSTAGATRMYGAQRSALRRLDRACGPEPGPDRSPAARVSVPPTGPTMVGPLDGNEPASGTRSACLVRSRQLLDHLVHGDRATQQLLRQAMHEVQRLRRQRHVEGLLSVLELTDDRRHSRADRKSGA